MALKIARAPSIESPAEAAQRAFANGDLDRAAECFLKALETEPNDPRLYLQVGVVFYQQEKFDKAVFALRRCLELDGGLVDAHNAMGVVLFRLGWYAAAEAFFHRVLELDPAHSLARQSLIEAMRASREKNDTVEEGLLPIVKLAKPNEPRLSLCMIVKNEEQFLDGCLESVKGQVDEIVLVDTGSTDRTLEIAAKHGARIFHRPWDDDFSAARNESLKHATGDWILVLDADERLAPNSRAALVGLMRNAAVVGYSMLIENKLGDGKGPSAQMATVFRLFRNRPDVRYEGLIHEQVIHTAQATGMKTQLAEVKIEHLGYLQTWMDSRGKLARNLEILERQQVDEPENPFVHYNLGQTLKMLGRHEEAAARYEEALHLLKARGVDSKIPYYANLYFALSDLYRQMKRFEQAYALLAEGVALYPNFPDLFYTRAFTYMDQERYPEAIDEFQHCQGMRGFVRSGAAAPSICTYKGLNAIGVCYARLGERSQAKHFLRKALDEHPNPDAELLCNLGILHMQDDEWAEAIDHFTRAIERDPKENRAWVNLATLSQRLGRPREAADAWEKVLELDPHLPNGRLFWAEALLRSGQAEKAGVVLERALAEHPDQREGWLNDGLRRLIEGQNDQARAAWERFEADPECAALLDLLGVMDGQPARLAAPLADTLRTWGVAFDVLLANGQADRLQVVLDRLEELGTAVRGLEIVLASMLVRHGLKELALGILLAGQPRHTDDPSYYTALGNACLELGHRDDARVMFEQALRMDPAHAHAQAQLRALTSSC